MKIFIKEKGFFLAGFVVLFFVVIVNLFPAGYVLTGGDMAQLIHASENLKSFFYEWQGRLNIFYSFFWILDKIGVGDTRQLSFYLGLFLFGSYASFYLFIKILFKKTSSLLKMLVALFYALNLYTLYIFSYSWGYSAYQYLYIFIPLLVAFYIKFITTQKNIWGALFLITIFFSSSGFGNPAFSLSFGIILLVLTMLLGLFKFFKWNKISFQKIGGLAAGSFFVLAYLILPLIPQMKGGVENLYSGNIIDLDWWLQHTSNPLVDTFRLSQYSNWYFPDNFPYAFLFKYQVVFIILSILPAFFIASGWFIYKRFEERDKKYFIIFSAVLLVLVMLIAKVRSPFEIINNLFYHIWGFNTLRGYEKFAIYTPFVFAVLLLISAKNWALYTQEKFNAYGNIIPGLFLIIVLATPLPFYLGKLQQNMSAIFVRDTIKVEEKDYQKAKYSFLVKIPDEYYHIQKVINSDQDIVKIAALPYNAIDSIGWSNYPKWKLVGTDITRELYNKKFIDANSFYFNDWLFAKDFSESDRDPEWVVKLLGFMNAKYIIFHKDVDPQFLENTADQMKELEEKKIITPVDKNDYFTLYKIDSAYLLPLIRWEQKQIDVEANSGSVDRNFLEIKNDSTPAEFKIINPKKYEVDGKNLQKDARNLIFAEPYDPNWDAYAVTQSGNRISLKDHFKAIGYANGWKVDNPEKISKIIIEYYPMRLAYYGMAISSFAVLGLIGYIVVIWKKRQLIF